jgi:hypothetical protein
MLVFLPVLILLAAAISGTILVLTKRGGGFIWAIGFISALAIWIFSLVVPVSSYPSVSVTNWLPFSQVFSGFTFKVDLSSIAYIFCTSTIALSFVITSTVHLQSADWRRGIILILLTSGLGILSLVSLDPFSLLITWTLLDFCVLGSDLWFARDNPEKQKVVTSFVIKLMGSFAIMAGVVASGGKGFNFDLAAIPPEVALIFLSASILRFWGILHNFPKMEGGYFLSTQVLIKLISFSSAIALLSRLPALNLSSTGSTWILISVILVGLWSAARVMLASDLSMAIPFFLSGFGSLQIYCVIENHAEIALLWGCLVLIIGSSLGTFLKFRRFHSILPSLGLFLAVGIPFTLGGMGLTGLINPFSTFSVFMLIILLSLLVGIARIVWQMEGAQIQVDQPISTIYMVGSLVLPISIIILGAKIVGDFISNPNIVISGVLLVVGILLSGIYYRVRTTFHPKETANSFIRFVRQVQTIGKWNLPARFLQAVIQLMNLSVKLMSNILEGDGGFLWTLVLLAVMISVISLGGG